MNTTINALKPVSLEMDLHGNSTYGEKPLPHTLISDALSQNILYNCYSGTKTIEDLSKLCGVPAFYIEDSVSRLISREALTEPVKGKYQTDFLIYGSEQAEYAEKAASLIGNITDEFLGALKEFTDAVLKELNIYTAGKPVNELYYLFGALVMQHLNEKYNPLKWIPYKEKYDGQKWKYAATVAGTKDNPSMGMSNTGGNGNYLHCTYAIRGFIYKAIGNDVTVCEKIYFGQELSEDEKEIAANLIKDGRLTRHDDGEITVNIPLITLEQRKAFNALADKYFGSVALKIADTVKKYVDGYEKLFPKHLKEDVEQAMHYFFIGGFYANFIQIARDRNLLDAPPDNAYCDIIIQYKE